MKVLLDIPDQHAASLLDVLRHISYVTATPLDADVFDAPLEFPNPADRIRKPGCMRGKIWMADALPNLEGDAPIEEFAEYSEPVKKRPKLGGWEGKIQIADALPNLEGDAPLEEFEDTCGFEEPAPLANKEFKFGGMRGKIWMADDFDAPMEEFAEYM